MASFSPRAGFLPPSETIKGRPTPLHNGPGPNSKHFLIKDSPMNGSVKEGTWDHLLSSKSNNNQAQQIILGMGCFWCSENLFMKVDSATGKSKIPGILNTSVGYCGGETLNPSYEEVCTGRTNHNEVCRIIYDPMILDFKDIMKIFWMGHDPTTKNAQGGDRGTQYRSEIFFFTEEQRKIAEETKMMMQKKIDNEFGNGNRVVSTLISDGNDEEKNKYYLAEDYHQQYDAKPGTREYNGLRPLRFKDMNLG